MERIKHVRHKWLISNIVSKIHWTIFADEPWGVVCDWVTVERLVLNLKNSICVQKIWFLIEREFGCTWESWAVFDRFELYLKELVCTWKARIVLERVEMYWRELNCIQQWVELCMKRCESIITYGNQNVLKTILLQFPQTDLTYWLAWNE
jgi:hypothetical protein